MLPQRRAIAPVDLEEHTEISIAEMPIVCPKRFAECQSSVVKIEVVIPYQVPEKKAYNGRLGGA
jgi:hypothetical protein